MMDKRSYGATQFAYATHEPIDGEHCAWIAFRMGRVGIRMEVRLPRREECRSAASYEQKVRTRWRMFVLLVRARLETVANGVQTLEEAFLPDVVTESGQTVAEVLRPQLEVAHATGVLPVLLPVARAAVVEGQLEDDGAQRGHRRHRLLQGAPHVAGALAGEDATEDLRGDNSRRALRRRGPSPPFPRSARDEARRAVAELSATAEVVPVDQITSLDQRFVCTPLAGKFTARTCLARQAQAAGVRAGSCYRCPLGAEVKKRVGRAVSTPSKRDVA
jgi:hypothetical protein